MLSKSAIASWYSCAWASTFEQHYQTWTPSSSHLLMKYFHICPVFAFFSKLHASLGYLLIKVGVLPLGMVIGLGWFVIMFNVNVLHNWHRWQWFLANLFPLLLKISYDHGWIFWLTAIPFLSQSFCLLVQNLFSYLTFVMFFFLVMLMKTYKSMINMLEQMNFLTHFLLRCFRHISYIQLE